jgi:hypothetical protein
MTDEARKAYAADVRRWRKALEQLTVETVRMRFALPGGRIIDDPPPYPPPEFVAAWLREKQAEIERRDTQRFRTMVIIGMVAAMRLIPLTQVTPYSRYRSPRGLPVAPDAQITFAGYLRTTARIGRR